MSDRSDSDDAASLLPRYVGVTGLPGAGKGTLIAMLRDLLAERRVRVSYYSLSDELREEARRRALPLERPVLRDIANELRMTRGNGVLAQIVGRRIRRELPERNGASVAVIDAIRNPAEVSVLREEFGARFILVALEAPLDFLIERIANRARYDEAATVIQRADAARQMILAEAGKGEQLHGHNIAECVAVADWRIDNSGGLEALREYATILVNRIVLMEQSGQGEVRNTRWISREDAI